MNVTEHPVFGRKVFFIEPQANIAQFVIPKLIEKEYEVYTVASVAQAKNYLRGNPDSIVFFCVNPSMSIAGWLNFIKSFKDEEVLSTQLPGIIAYRLSKIERELLMLHTDLPAGYLEMQPTPDSMTEMIANVLELNGAMGRRRYVRADCSGDRAMYVMYSHEGNQLMLPVDNISSVGLAFRCEDFMVPLFPENSVMRNCTLVMHTDKIQFDAAIIMTKTDGKKPIVVVLFMKGSVNQYKSVLQRFIASRIQYNMDLKFETQTLDDTDYEAIEVTEGGQHDSGENMTSSGNHVQYADDGILEELRALGDDTVN